MVERETFHDVLHNTPRIWQSVRFKPAWTSEQIEALLRPHAKGFQFRVVGQEFEDGIAFTIRSNDYYESPVHRASFTDPDKIPRELTLFHHGYIGWLRWAADELERANKDFMESHPHPALMKGAEGRACYESERALGQDLEPPGE
jgi:hypothetical protein